MKAIIIQDHDVVALIEKLQLDGANKAKRFAQQDERQEYVANECYRSVHHILVCWAQEHGAVVHK